MGFATVFLCLICKKKLPNVKCCVPIATYENQHETSAGKDTEPLVQLINQFTRREAHMDEHSPDKGKEVGSNPTPPTRFEIKNIGVLHV